jgi:hypothetical protein
VKRIFCVALFVTACITTPAVAAGLSSGVALALVHPTGDFDKTHDPGWGIHAAFDYSLIPLVTLTGDFGWNTFQGKEIGIPDVDIWEFSAGGKVNLAFLYAGAEVGYFTDVKEWDVIPFLGARLGPFDAMLRYKAAGDVNWAALRLGFFF